jgi:hypothetical protein
MKTLINSPCTYYSSHTKVTELVTKLNEDADGWRYEVEQVGKYYAIAVYDEDGLLCGKL